MHFLFNLFFETEAYYMAQAAGLELMTLLP
jgi:hypothetical protein